MKIYALALLMAILLASANAVEKREEDDDDEDITTLTFLVEYEPEDDNELIEIGLTIQAKDPSLHKAMIKAKDIVTKVKNLAETYCENGRESDEQECNDVVDVSEFQIEAEYVKRRKELVFEEFVVSHEVSIKVYDTENIGYLADNLLKTEVTKIDSFDWVLSEEVDDEEQAFEQGKQKSEQMCFHLGMKLHRIVSIEVVEDEEDEKEDQQQDEDEEQEDEPLVYRFEVECVKDAETEAAKNREQQEQDKAEEEEEQKKDKKKKGQDDDEDEDDDQPKRKQKKDKVKEDKKKGK